MQTPLPPQGEGGSIQRSPPEFDWASAALAPIHGRVRIAGGLAVLRGRAEALEAPPSTSSYTCSLGVSATLASPRKLFFLPGQCT
jgi:hypothetical protein